MSKKINSPEALRALREQVKADVAMRTGPKKVRVAVHMGTCGIASGALDVLTELAADLTAAHAQDVSLKQASCRGLCDQEPMMTVTDDSGAEFCYAKLDRSKVKQIVQQHLVQGQPVAEYLVQPKKQ